jgi:hypothetical protein
MELMEIIKSAIEIMKKEPNTVNINHPRVIVVGDIHG